MSMGEAAIKDQSSDELVNKRNLIEQLIDELAPLLRGRFELEVHDVDENEQWRDAYGELVPVVHFNGQEVCRYHLDRASIMRILTQESTNI